MIWKKIAESVAIILVFARSLKPNGFPCRSVERHWKSGFWSCIDDFPSDRKTSRETFSLSFARIRKGLVSRSPIGKLQ